MIHRVCPRSFVPSSFLVLIMLATGTPLQAADEFLPPLPQGQEWKLAWSDEFDGARIDQTKWDVMGDWKRRDGFWVKEDAYLDGQGHLILRTKKDGERYKQLVHRDTGVKCDLFIVPDKQEWGALYLVRTGPAEFNQALMRVILRKGWHLTGNRLHQHGKCQVVRKGKRQSLPCEKGARCPLIIPTLSEQDFLGALGLPWVEPDERSAAWVRQHEKAALGIGR